MKAIGIIPARWASTRFPGKPLALISGRPLLAWVIEGAKTSKLLSEIAVATDDERIAKIARECGVQALMTDSDLPTGTDRIWQASQQMAALTDTDVVVNIQGDEPLIEGSLLDRLIEPFQSDSQLEMATLGRALDLESLNSSQVAKIVVNVRGEAMYFSRFPIPYSREKELESSRLRTTLKHIGLYGYTQEFLQKFCSSPVADIERYESLEQLRALYLGAKIKVLQVEKPTYGVDTPEDLQKLEALLK